MSKFVGFIVGAALIAVGVLTANPALIIQGSAMIITQAIVDLTAPKQPARQASEMTIALGEQPRVMLVGETFTPGSLVDGFDYGGKYGTDWEVLIIRLADEPCESLTGFYVNDEYVPYTGDGNYPQFDSHHFSLWFRSNTSTVALPSVVTDHGPGWTSDDIGASGCDVIVAYLSDAPDAKKPAWPGGRPHFGFVVKGGKRYDPRLDSTVTGGSGSHRIDDPTTWEWTENAVINWYGFERGVYVDGDTTDQTKLLVGRGLSAEESPPENIFAAANLCDNIAAAIYPYTQVPASGVGVGGFGFGLGGAMIRWDGNGAMEWWSDVTRTYLGITSGPPSGSGPAAGTVTNVAVASDGTAYYYGTTIVDGFNHLYTTPYLGTTSMGLPIGDNFHREPGPCRVFDYSDGTQEVYGAVNWDNHGGYYLGDALTDDAKACLEIFRGASDSVWGVFEPFGVSSSIEIRQLKGGATTFTFTAAARTDPGSAVGCYVASQNHFFIAASGHWYLIDDTTGAIKSSGTQSWDTNDWVTGRLQQAPGDNTFFYSVMQQISLEDGSTIRSLTSTDWVTESLSDPAYDAVNNAIVSHNDTGGRHVTFRLLDRNGGYRVAGPIYSTQEFIDVEGMFAAAVGGNIVTFEGSILLEPGQSKSVVATISDDDLLVGSEVNWNQGFLSESDGEWVNTVVGTYVEPDQKWNSHNTPPLRDTADITADGKPREATITLRLVRYAAQAMRVSEINRRLGRLWGRATVKLGPRFCELEAGDWISWQSDRYFAGATKTFRIDANNVDEKWQNALTLRSISTSVYADDATFPADHSRPITTPPPADTSTPTSGTWTLAATTMVSAGASVPALELTGVASDDDTSAESIIVEYWLDDGIGDPVADPDSVTWTMVGTYASTTEKIDITGLTGGATYYVALAYIVSGIPGDRLVLGPETVADVDVSGQVNPLIAAATDALPWKKAVRAATTSNHTLSTAYANGSVIDGVTLATGNRVLIKNQTTGSQNGIYVVAASGTPARSTDADSGAELVNATVMVSEGTVNADTAWTCTNNATITVGSTALVWAPTGPAVQDEGVAQGAVNTFNFTGAGVSSTVSAGVATVNVSGAAIGSGWSTALSGFDFSSSNQATKEVNVTGYNEIFISGDQLVHAASVQRCIEFSVDGGSTWFNTSGDYQDISTGGSGASNIAIFGHVGATASARNIAIHVKDNFGQNPVNIDVITRSIQQIFRGSATAVNRIRLIGVTGGTTESASNFTGGKLWVYGR